MKAIPFPQANKVLKAPPSPRSEIQQRIDELKAQGSDVVALQERLDEQFPPEQEVYDLHVWGGEVDGIPRCISCWEPSPEERALIAAGGPVWLWVVGHTHPPLVLDAASPFEPAEKVDLLTPEERRSVEIARIASSLGDDTLLAIIDRLTGSTPQEATE